MDMELSIIKEEVPMNPRVVLGIVRHVRDSWAVFQTSQIRILSSVLTYTLRPPGLAISVATSSASPGLKCKFLLLS